MEPFWNYLDQLIVSGEQFSLEALISTLTFDVIGAAVLAVDLHAQHIDPSKQGELIHLFRQFVQTYNDDKNNLPWWIAPFTGLNRNQSAERIDILIKTIIQQKYTELKEEAGGNRWQSIVALGLRESEALTPSFYRKRQINALQWAFYELSRTPRALKAVRDELDDVLGPEPDPRIICATFAQNGDSLLSRIYYIYAVIRETLRLHLPAGTVRMIEPGIGFTIRASTGEEYYLDGIIMYSCQSIIQRDSDVYGDTADDWAPERWLDEKVNSIPPSAWRPFERGQRACIGSELANLESRVIIAIVARKYEFIRTGSGESVLD